MIKWIICDLDGTIIKHDKKEHKLTISKSTVDKINKIIKSKKYKFTIATGRHWLNAKQLLTDFGVELGDDTFIIGMNGAQIYDSKTDKLIYKKFLSKESMDNIYKIQDYMEKNYNDQYIFIAYGDNNKFLYLKNKKSKKFELMKDEMDKYESFDENTFETLVVNDFSNHPNIFKIIVCFFCQYNYEKEMAIFSEIEKDMDYIKSDVKFLEGMPKNTDKWYALEFLRNNYYYDMDKSNMMIFGDSYNDLMMLKNAGTSITRSSADEQIKKVCTYVIDAEASDFVADGIDLLLEE